MADFVTGEDDRQILWPRGVDDLVEPRQLDTEHDAHGDRPSAAAYSTSVCVGQGFLSR